MPAYPGSDDLYGAPNIEQAQHAADAYNATMRVIYAKHVEACTTAHAATPVPLEMALAVGADVKLALPQSL